MHLSSSETNRRASEAHTLYKRLSEVCAFPEFKRADRLAQALKLSGYWSGGTSDREHALLAFFENESVPAERLSTWGLFVVGGRLLVYDRLGGSRFTLTLPQTALFFLFGG